MIDIRRFQQEDEKKVRELIDRIMTQEFGDDVSAYPTEDIDNIQKAYGELGEAFFVAVDEDKVVGTVGIKKEDERVALLRRLFVSPDYRRRQIGVKLIDNALQFCGEVGYGELVFKTTSNMTGAIQVCQKKGFTQRARLNLGSIELLKFVLPIQNGIQAA